jgi:hypothetical protein
VLAVCVNYAPWLRRGQKEFREALLDAYAGRCGITQCDATAVLEAARIVPYAGEHTHRQDNGLLLRSDIHTLFALGLLWIDPASMCVEAAEQLLVPGGRLSGAVATP